LQARLAQQLFPGEERINEHLEDLNDGINSVLFESRDFEEARMKLELLRQRAERFVAQIVSLTN
jgi:hypothetical protein